MLNFSKFLLIIFSFLLFSCSSILVNEDRLLNEKEIVLTFDDEPNVSFQTTKRLLETLNKHQVKAYFCIIGMNARKYPDLVRSLDSNNQIIVNHGLSDKQIAFKSKDKIIKEMAIFDSTISSILEKKYQTRYFRPPYGIYPLSLKSFFNENKIEIIPVSFYAMDAEVKPEKKDVVLNNILKYIDRHKRAIIVLHDGKDSYYKLEKEIDKNTDDKYNRSWIPEITDKIIDTLKLKGYSFKLLE